jgi:hypothetical protein
MMGGMLPERITFAGEEFDLKWDSVFVQVALVGAVCFCEPGLYNAIVSMAGGIVSVALLFALAAAARPGR